MVEITSSDIDIAFEKMLKIKDFKRIESLFSKDNRVEIYSFIEDVVDNHADMDRDKEYVAFMAIEIVYFLWKLYYNDRKVIEDIFGKDDIDYSAINDDIIELASANFIDYIKVLDKDNILKMFDMKKERIRISLCENKFFFKSILILVKNYFNEDPMIGGILAFYSIEESMKRKNREFKANSL